jgi:LCP family protein required for cell wall assembly
LLKRFLIGSLVIFAVTTAATTSSVLIFFEQTAAKFRHVNVGHELTTVSAGKPQTIMIVGSDRRYGDRKRGLKARSDTILLVRLDPNKGAAFLSLPRDLKVSIPGYGVQKINAAYSLGGPKLTIKTVKQLTGLKINHYVDVSFHGFSEGVNAIGCVYVDVDRRYFNNNSGLGYGQQYAVIDIKPGYQRMCGQRALQYVRYRHTDTDIVRNARQQDFLRELRGKLSVGKLINKHSKLIDIFARNTASDIRSAGALRKLLRLALAIVRKPINQVRFHVSLGKSYVYTSSDRVQGSVRQFLRVAPGKGPLAKERRKAPNARRANKRRKHHKNVNLINATFAGREQAALADQHLRFPVYYPRALLRGSSYVDAPRVYRLEDLDGHRHRAYKMVISTGFIGEYYGVEGMNWLDPPILDSPSETRRFGRRSYMLFYSGDRLRRVGWRTSRGAYWISNTLLQTLSSDEMLGIARSLRRAG